MNKHVVIAGGTGFIGSYLLRRFREDGSTVQIIARGKGYISWEDSAAITRALDAADLLINLAGKPITAKFTEENKKELIGSRVATTQKLGEALMKCTSPPELWLNASGAHIYGTDDSYPHTERDKTDNSFFLAQMAQVWEEAFFAFHKEGTRQVALRTSIVLGKGGGVLQPYINLTRLGLGGTQGGGAQKFTWIHIEDYYQILLFLAGHPAVSGPVNICSPQAVTNEALMRSLRRQMHMPVGVPAPSWLIKIGTGILGIESDLVLKGLWALPEVLQENGFLFRFPDVDSALKDILA